MLSISNTTFKLLNNINQKIGNKKTKNNKLLSITVCVNYSDYLRECLPINSKLIDKLVIVTDVSDIETINCCKQYENVELLISDRLHKGNLRFNKSALINHALDIYGSNYEWILILDSDIMIHGEIKLILEKLDINYLYGAKRRIYRTKSDYINNKYKTGRYYGIGYFQLFNTGSKIWNKNPRYEESTNNSNNNFWGPDMWFANNWEIRLLNNVTVDHLGPNETNYKNRKSEKWQDS